MNFVARLRVRMKVPITAEILPATLSVPGFPPIELNQETRTPPVCSQNAEASCPASVTPRPDGERFTFIMRGFANEAMANSVGRQLADGLLASGAVGNLGIDIGFDRATLQFSSQVHDAVRTESGRELRGDLFGLMTYAKDTVAIIRLDAHGFTSTSVQAIEGHLTRWARIGETMTERQRTCAAILNDAFYAGQQEAQFILCISAVEALCDQRDLSSGYIALVDNLLTSLSDLDGDVAYKETLRDVLRNARRESIGQACRAKLRARLGDESAAQFGKLYALRSRFVHDGRGRGDLQAAAGEARQIAVRLLEADLQAQIAP